MTDGVTVSPELAVSIDVGNELAYSVQFDNVVPDAHSPHISARIDATRLRLCIAETQIKKTIIPSASW